MKTKFYNIGLLLTLIVAVAGCSDIELDRDSVDGVGSGHTTIEITSENFEEIANGNTPVLLDFWATWCGPCVGVAPTLEKLADEYGGKLIIGKVNIDEQKAIAEKFNIGPIPAFFYIKNGEIVGDQVGAQSEDAFKAKIAQAFSL